MNEAVPTPNPFIGLRPFERRDSLYFFGRGDQTKALLQKLYTHRFVAVVGSSGAGKSSLIRAGLIPHLEAGFLVQDRDIWYIAMMKPGASPLYNLAKACLIALDERPSEDQIQAFSDDLNIQSLSSLLEHLQKKLEMAEANLLLVIDQFEELFRFNRITEPDGYQKAAVFVDLILRLTKQNEASIYVCMTMRSDFLGDCDAFEGLPEAMNQSQYLVPRLTWEQRREAILGPVYLAGVDMTPGLLERLLNENVGTRDDLPILQHALMRTWSHWAEHRGGPIDMVDYNNSHTVKEALSKHAEEAMQGLSKPEEQIAQRLFQTLTETDAGNRRIRRPAHLSEIASVSGVEPDRVKTVIDQFCKDDRNFLVLSSENQAGDPLIDISHESLIRQWPTLSAWVDQEAESSRIYLRLAETAERHAQNEASLYRDADLQVALNWYEGHKPTAIWGRRYHPGFNQAIEFLEKSRLNDVREKKLKRFGLWAMCFGIFLLAFLLLLTYKSMIAAEKAQIEAEALAGAEKQAKSDAEKSESEAKTAQVIAERARDEARYHLAKIYREKGRQARASGNLYLSMHYIAEAIETTPNEVISRAMVHDLGADLLKLRTLQILQHDASVREARLSKDGNRILSWSDDKRARLWDANTGHLIASSLQHHHTIRGPMFSHDSQSFLTWDDGWVRLWMTDSGELIYELPHQSPIKGALFGLQNQRILTWSNNTARLWQVDTGEQIGAELIHDDSVLGAMFSPDNRHVLTWGKDQTARLWEVSPKLQLKLKILDQGEGLEAAFSHNGEYILTWSYAGSAKLWNTNVETAKLVKSFPHQGDILEAKFSYDDQYILTRSTNNTVKLWEVDSGKLIEHPFVNRRYVVGARLSHKNPYLAVWSNDNKVKVWSVTTGQQIGFDIQHNDLVRGSIFSHDDQYVLTWSEDQMAQLWEVNSGQSIGLKLQHQDTVEGAFFSHDAKRILTWSKDKTVRLWEVNLKQQRELQLPHDRDKTVNGGAFSQNNRRILTWSADDTARLWKAETGELIKPVLRHRQDILGARFFKDDQRILTWSTDNTARLWKAETGELIEPVFRHRQDIHGARFSRDQKRILTWSFDQTARLWEVGKKEPILSGLGHRASLHGARFSHNETRILTWSSDNTARVWNAETGKREYTLRHNDSVGGAVFSQDDQRVLTWSKDNTARVWDAATGQRIHLLLHRHSVRGARFYDSDQHILTWSSDKTAKRWNANSGELVTPNLKHDNAVRGAVFSQDERRIVTWSSDGRAKVWDAVSGEQIGPDLQHQNSVGGARFSNHEALILTWSLDRTAKVWDAHSAHLEQILQHPKQVHGAIFSHDDKQILTWGEDHIARVWDVPGDIDFPKEHFTLQAKFLTGTQLNLKTQKLEMISADQFEAIKKEYIKIASEHAAVCKYPRQNVYLALLRKAPG